LGALQAGVESLESLPFGVIIINSHETVVRINAYAGEVIAAHDGLSIRREHILACNLSERSELAAAIHRACISAMGNSLAVVSGLCIHRPSQKRAYILKVSPIRSPLLLNGQHSAGAVVFVTDPELQPELDEDLLARLYDLTHSQAKLAAALFRGQDLSEYCEQARISRNTGRTHLRLLFEKLGVGRQAELVSLLARSLVASSRRAVA
jgi:DNA-binding CsgD family transcriptional regulator